MLEPWIIEQIRRREEEERREREAPRLEVPLDDGRREEDERRREWEKRRERDADEEGPSPPERGIAIIDYGVA